MKIAYPDIDYVFDTESEKINTLVIENPELLFSILDDINNQMLGYDGNFVVSQDGKILDTVKYVEVISQFVPFDINKKTILNKIASSLEKNAIIGEHYEKTMMLMNELESFLTDVAFDLVGDISFSKIEIGQIIKASGLTLSTDYASLGEKLIDYFELVSEYERKKVFILLNLRSFISLDETESFLDTVKRKGFDVVLIDNREYPRLNDEKRVIIDIDLCEII